MACTAKVIEDSYYVRPDGTRGPRLTTVQTRSWRATHAELMTHRVFSRNASSSRAIPVRKMLAQVWNDPAGPIHWGANQPGMQAHSELQGTRRWLAMKIWRLAGRVACALVWVLDSIGLHKQVANRLLEPWQYISVIITATEWDNFFALRIHPDAQPEIRELAMAIKVAMANSTPKRLRAGEWHLPYVTAGERYAYDASVLVRVSAGRCARVSYLNHDATEPDVYKDAELCNRLVRRKPGDTNPIHASPVEHQALPFVDVEDYPMRRSNLVGWMQHRKLVELGASVQLFTDAERIGAGARFEVVQDDLCGRAS